MKSQDDSITSTPHYLYQKNSLYNNKNPRLLTEVQASTAIMSKKSESSHKPTISSLARSGSANIGKLQRNLTSMKSFNTSHMRNGEESDGGFLEPQSNVLKNKKKEECEGMDGKNEVVKIEGKEFLIRYKTVEMRDLKLKIIPVDLNLFSELEVESVYLRY